MNKLSLTTAVTAVLIAVAWLATPAMPQTDIVVDPTAYDFEGESGSVTISIYNGYSDPFTVVYITYIELSGSSQFAIESGPSDLPRTLESGGTEFVNITYTLSAGRSEAELLTKFEVTFFGNTLSTPEVTVQLSGGVEADAGVKEVNIDIKPGGNPNSINLKSKGVVPVAALTDGGFEASSIDPESVAFAGAEPVRWKMADVDDDGDMDMLLHFKTQDLNLDESSTEATLTGETNDGQDIQGTDTVIIVSGSSRPSLAPRKYSTSFTTWGKMKAK